MTPTASALLELARLSLALGRTERITRDEFGNFESVATHTVSLAWAALSLADRFFPWLDKGEIAVFALCHDAPEAVCGDTPTLRITPRERQEEAERELAAFWEIDDRVRGLPWLTNGIRDYEARKDGKYPITGSDSQRSVPAAAFVRAVDKIMPKLTHLLNGGVTLRESGIGFEELKALLDRQRGELLASLPAEVGEPLAELQRELSDLTLALPLEPRP